MSDIEEPPTKVTKYEMSQTYTQDEIEEGQEEWLSEGLLTDDDIAPENHENSTTDPDRTRSDLDTKSEGRLEDSLDESIPEVAVQGFVYEQHEEHLQDTLNEQVLGQTFQEEVLPEESFQESSQEGTVQESVQEEVLKETLDQETTQEIPAQESQEETLQESLGEEVLPLQDQIPQESQEDTVQEGLQEEVAQESLQETLQQQEEHVQEAADTKTEPVKTQDNTAHSDQTVAVKVDEGSIEKTLNSMNSAPADELDEFLMKTEGAKPSKEEKAKESDGNDTDDLLRMLEDDDKSKKAKIKTKTAPKSIAKKAPSSDEDDEYVYNGTTVKKVSAVKTSHRKPLKAVPESSGDESSEEASAMRSVFLRTRPPVAKLPARANIASYEHKPGPERKPIKTSTPLRQYSNNARSRSLLKPPLQTQPAVKAEHKPILRTYGKKPKPVPEEIIDEEEFLEDDDFDLGEDFGGSESDSALASRAVRQRLMRPETMDEDMMSDGESNSEHESLYDELPSSEEEELDEWFTLDLRAERAGEYLPLLGTKAYDLLLQERSRMTSRLTSLRAGLVSVRASGAQQANKLRAATRALNDVDDMLKAA